jgi:hypothetical protein
MRILSATEAISPAIARMQLVLFKPFRFGRSWKFSATAYVSTMGSFFFPFPLLGLFIVPAVFHEGPKWLIWAIVSGIALLFALMTFIFALGSRLQFPFMDVVMNRSVFIAPLWRQYGPQAHRWTQAKILIGTVTMLVSTVPFVPFVWLGIRRMKSIQAFDNSQQSPLPFAFFGIFLLIYSGFILVTLAMSLLNDFMLPPLVLEDASVTDAWRWVVKLIRTEPEQVALYALLKVVLGFISQMACVIVFEIAIFVLMLVLGIVGVLLAGFLHAIHAPDVIFQALAIVAIVVIDLGFIGYCMPLSYGLPMVFLEAYKLYFLGGRYAPLGDILDRTTPPPDPMPQAPVFGYVPMPSVPPSAPTL